MQTEPIGFKGSPGDFSFDETWHMEYAIYVPSGLNVLKAARIGLPQAEANAKLMAASKKMAIALQRILENTNESMIHPDIWDESKEALKEAGL